jgi:hypothetical protein
MKVKKFHRKAQVDAQPPPARAREKRVTGRQRHRPCLRHVSIENTDAKSGRGELNVFKRKFLAGGKEEQAARAANKNGAGTKRLDILNFTPCESYEENGNSTLSRNYSDADLKIWNFHAIAVTSRHSAQFLQRGFRQCFIDGFL